MKEVVWEGGIPSHEGWLMLDECGKSWMMGEEMIKNMIIMLTMMWMFVKVMAKWIEVMEGGGRDQEEGS